MIIDKMEKDELTYHVPVLLKESVDGMNIQPDGTYVDVTFGGAGHSREILSRLGEGGRLLGFDQDEDLFASFSLSPMINAAVVLGCYSLLLTTAFRGLQKDTVRPASGTAKAKKTHVPVFVICCGLLVSWAYAADGSVAEWGSLYLFSCRGADEETAALAYGAFSVTSGVFRLFDDRLRSLWGDMRLSVGGALLAFGGMAIALVSPEPWFCLAGYCLMGMGLSPMVPIFFSRAGSCPGVAPEQASAAVSLLGYSGLLLFPPTLGFLGRTLGLDRALLVPLGLCALLALGAFCTLKFRRALHG